MAGTISRGIKAPIIREGDDIVKIVADSVLAAVEQDGFQLHERDVICVTEAVVARADGNYASTEDIAADVKAKLGGETVGVVFPILSRNRFAAGRSPWCTDPGTSSPHLPVPTLCRRSGVHAKRVEKAGAVVLY